MSGSRTVEDKVADWLLAYQAIKAELTPEAFVTLAATAHQSDNVQGINIGIGMARLVFANDRAAATVAALLVQSGIKPTGFDYGDMPE